jgi:hypothetical protein
MTSWNWWGVLAGAASKAMKKSSIDSASCRLIVLHRQHVVGAAVPNGLGDVGLGAHGIDRDDTAFQGQGRQQFREWPSSRSISRAVARCPRTSPAPAAKALTRCSGVASTLPERRLVLPSMATTAPYRGWGNRADPAHGRPLQTRPGQSGRNRRGRKCRARECPFPAADSGATNPAVPAPTAQSQQRCRPQPRPH